MALLECLNVTIAYGNQEAVSDVSFAVEPGEYIAIVGENGSGKSTLLQGMLGLLPIRSGSIRLHSARGRVRLGYLPQQTAIQRDFPASVEEVVLTGCLGQRGLRPFYNREERARVEQVVEQLQIAELRQRSYRTLSGGQQQRVLLARALATQPDLLVLDEPTTGLDPAMTSDFYQLLRRLHHDHQLTVVMTSHDIQAALQQAERILHLNRTVQFYGRVDEYRQSESSRRFLRWQDAIVG